MRHYCHAVGIITPEVLVVVYLYLSGELVRTNTAGFSVPPVAEIAGRVIQQPTQQQGIMAGISKRLITSIARNLRDHDASSSVYAPLGPDEIRVLSLSGGSFDAPIKCKLLPMNIGMAERLDYCAISYTWGSPEKQSTITVNGKPFPVTANAEETLRYARWEDGARFIWMDSICINQNDNAEKSSQVKMMGDIYKKAKGVFAFVGNDADGSGRKAMDMIIRVARNTMDSMHLMMTGGIPDHVLDTPKYSSSVPSLLTDPPSNHPDWVHVEDFFRRPWFQRVWIVQEVNLAKKAHIFCGSKGISWGAVTTATFWMVQNQVEVQTGRPGLDVVHHVQNTCRARDDSLFHLMHSFGNHEATDPRDYIFGVLGLANDVKGWDGGLPAELRIDYERSAGDVFVESTRWMMRKEKSLHLLNVADQNRNDGEEWQKGPDNASGLRDLSQCPSWVPRWDMVRAKPKARHTLSDIELEDNVITRGFCASKGSKAKIEDLTPKGMLRVHGFRIDKITRISPAITLNDLIAPFDGPLGKAILNIWKDYVDPNETYPSGEDILTAYGLTMRANIGPAMGPAHKDNDSFAAFATYFAAQPEGVSSDNLTTDQLVQVMMAGGGEEGYRTYRRAILQACHLRCFFRTEMGRMGLCNPRAKVGDPVCILFGGQTPYVLHEVDGSTWSFAGAAYVHGLMYGEGMEVAPDKAIEIQVFRIL